MEKTETDNQIDNSLAFPRFLLYGDSITEYCFDQYPMDDTKTNFSFGAAITNAYVRKYEIVHRGFSGYNSEFSRILLPKLFALEHDSRPENTQIKIMTLFLGSNDAALAGPEAVPLARFEENIKFLIELVLSKGIKLLLIGPLWHNTEWYNSLYPEDFERGIYRTTANNLLYSDVLLKLALQFDVPYLNLWQEMELFNKTEDFNKLLCDGLHFSGEGYKFLFDRVMSMIQTHYPECDPLKIAMKLPTWENPDIIRYLKEL